MMKLVLGCLLLLAASTTQAQERQDSADAVRSIRAALAGWVDAANREDWKAAARVWAPDLVGWYPGQPDDTYTKEMESAAHPRPGRPRTRYEVDVVEVVVSGNMAVVRDIWRFTTAPGTPDSAVSVVRSYEVWKRQKEGQWKIGRWISAPEPQATPAAQTPQLDSVGRYVAQEMKRQQIPGLSVAILRGDRVLLARGYGFSNLELRVPASDSTIYQSGSLGKQFTATAVGMLAQQGRLDVEDRIGKWFPEGKGVWDSITVRQLLTHTSGMPEYTDSLIDLRKDYTEEQLVRLAASRPLDFRPGDAWSYSNTGYALLGVLIHRVTGRFYGDVLHQLLFSPLGMRTRIISEADLIPNRSAGYRLVENQVKNQEWVSPSLNTTADGALYLTVNDLAKWAVALNHRRLPDSPVLDAAWAPVRLNDGGAFPYGYGWDLSDQRGQRRVGHTGSWQGFKTAFYRYPDLDLSVAVLANLDQATPSAIAEGIAGILEPALQPPQLFKTALRGLLPPVAIPALLQRVAAGDEAGIVTPGTRGFLLPAVRLELGKTLQNVSTWMPLGCDSAPGRKIRWLSADVAQICYARGTGKTERTLVTVYYTADWQAAYFDLENY